MRLLQLDSEPVIHETSVIERSTLGLHSFVGRWCDLVEVTSGRYSFYHGNNRVVFSQIGNFVTIAYNVRINAEQHPLFDRVAQHNFTYFSHFYGLGEYDESVINTRRAKAVTIGNDVWFGHGAVVMGGIIIGNGAVIGANAVVTHDVAPYEIVAGVPARHLKYRFDPKTIDRIESTQWWDWSDELLKERLPDLKNVPLFCEKYATL